MRCGPRTRIGAGAEPHRARPSPAALVIGPWGLVVVVAAYAALSIAYSLRLKREPVMELAVVAAGFVLRAVAGGVVADVQLSNWFLVFTSFAALFVVTGKRHAEHARLGRDRGDHRQVLDEYTRVVPQVDPDDLGHGDRRLLLPVGVRTNRPLGARRAQVVWIELTVVPLVLSVLAHPPPARCGAGR